MLFLSLDWRGIVSDHNFNLLQYCSEKQGFFIRLFITGTEEPVSKFKTEEPKIEKSYLCK